MTDPEEIPIPDKVDCVKAKNLMEWIVREEDENIKTGKLSDAAMVHAIAKKILERAKCL